MLFSVGVWTVLPAVELLVVVACRLCALLLSVGVWTVLLLVSLRSLLRVAFSKASSACGSALNGADDAMPKKCPGLALWHQGGMGGPT